MPLFEYTANDESGRRVTGMLQGDNWAEVESELKKRGLRMTGVNEVKGQTVPEPIKQATTPSSSAAPGQTVQPQARPAAPPITHSASAPQPIIRQPQAQPARATAPPSSQSQTVRTARGSDKDVMFLFSQLAGYFRSGQNPAVAFENLSNSWQVKYRAALKDMADAASAGRSVADTMARYPNLFPGHVVGMYRAGEVGGFLPEACQSIATQAQESHRYHKIFLILAYTFWFTVGAIPVAYWGATGLVKAMQRMDATGGAEDGKTVVAQSMGTTAVPILIACLIGIVVAWGLSRWWTSLMFRPLRHRLTLWVPTVGKRARKESMAIFSWALSNLMKVGLSPRSAVEIAASAAPNAAIAEELGASARNMRSETKLSDAVQHIKLLGPEMKVMIQTGEMVGELPQQLEMVSQAQRDDYLSYQKQTQIRVGCWVILVMLFGSCVIGAWFQRMFYDGMFRVILGEDQTEVSQPSP